MTKTNYDYENDELLEQLFSETFYKAWINGPEGQRGFEGLEFIVTSECNLGCKYCYMSRNEDKLYPKNIRSKERILKNAEIVLDWMIENNYRPLLDFFSGSPLSSRVGLDTLWLIYEKYKDVEEEKRISKIVIPTNYTWLMNKDLTAEIEDLLAKMKDINIRTILSASIDGKYMEENRPFKNKDKVDYDEGVFFPEEDERDDAFYDRVFELNLKYDFGFHPMLYSSNVDKWKDNFLWYQEMLKKHNMPWYALYILEVRNVEWNTKQTESYLDFVEFLMQWLWDNPAGHDAVELVRLLNQRKAFNLLTNSSYSRARGTTCGLQTRMYVRLGDLAIVPCHRQSYEGYEYGRFKTVNNKIVGVEAINTELALAMSTFDMKTQPYCSDCMIKTTCMGGCMGSQLEVNGDPFVPIPSVCELIHKKLLKIVEMLVKFDAYKALIDNSDEDARTSLQFIYDEYRRMSQ